MFGGNKIKDHLIVMNNLSGIADSCKEFADFLTITQKYRCHCIYVFHIIIPDKDTCKIFFTSIQFLKYFKVIVYQQLQNMFLLERCD